MADISATPGFLTTSPTYWLMAALSPRPSGRRESEEDWHERNRRLQNAERRREAARDAVHHLLR